MYTLSEKALMAAKWLGSFFRREWGLGAYPVRIRPNGDGTRPGEKWLAQILNWPGPAGVGATQAEAVARLGETLEHVRAQRRQSGEKMPRPGSAVPLAFASTRRVLADPALHDDFIIRVLGFAPGSPVFISDESSLGDFGDETYVVTLRENIFHAYGVEVTDLREGRLGDIFDRIQKKR